MFPLNARSVMQRITDATKGDLATLMGSASVARNTMVKSVSMNLIREVGSEAIYCF